ncbi:wyosine [tRNA(Phe)-imidazoG37] synthetase (radical SAM superfamily) [Evansella vedderi]|uniref:Wyosine [tRNA(Phe)-imidazoG37] synthetase (Radical SAM superfamily) n=1 Tax=Evansella vedderi TaxID=38282 RepID=A0ABU0A0T0_9BACI|nr:hypothetical protein [Evansella vedderi]MDQ0257086.1 wyosine [tRNA(Phe)-imidazoG37] synthetase (radical SAM superfamily) [Evansella vedderi]
MNLVDLLNERLNESPEEKMVRTKIVREMNWKKEGEKFLERRNRLNLFRADISRAINVSSSRLRRFELGEGVREARLIARAYALAIEKEELNIEIRLLRQRLATLTNKET